MAADVPVPLVDITTSRFQVGQVWEYHTRPTETGSVLTVVKVELQHGTEVAVHIHVDGLKLKTPNPDGKPGTTASHLPFSEEALTASVTHVVRHAATLPDFEEGYELWREAFLAGQAGVFSVTVAEVMDFIESTFSNQ
ncbi:hypothetical protein [Hymenobacter chitinivorans]|uniref:Uncharacterized protein n=1 Tax=Hymenobacter chitinivorans DSM 11115 TaxID=1121954 RepID=A0A2M9B9N0_9BACT|nr:hypothetical protein [Hymenobacter chitinivorans]PJJ54652.1 hypothetical protein CLV45_2998 [Hymenobacter chitinivorans DSM 11115]